MKAMIFAAGYGTRLAPLTDNKPKALVNIAGKPMLQMQIEHLKSFGFNYIVINVHHFSDQIINFINSNDFGVEIQISDETNLLLNTGGGLKNVKKFFNEGDTFLLHNVDIYSEIDLKEMYNFHLKTCNIATLAVKHRESTNYLLFDETDRLCGWRSYKTNSEIISIEKTTYNEMAFSGIYVFNYNIFDAIQKEGSFPIIPELLNISKNDRIGAYNHDNKYMLDLGKPEAIKKCEELINS
ncbi:MAG: NTP transferase domain-containing protein [Bacteroidales bacterium]|jgi:NDP-sugar pyrophosphorylase family protein|nr:NTP transferase domain-containing protein [Bacteroidales bacterium]